MIRLHVMDNHIVDGAVSNNLAYIGQKLRVKIDFNGVHQANFLIYN